MEKKSKRIGVLTGGGDCPGLNATISGLVKSICIEELYDIVGFKYGFDGLVHGDYENIRLADMNGLISKGGTILKCRRTPHKKFKSSKGLLKLEMMVENYYKLDLDCLVCIGGAGTHKNAMLLKGKGLNVIALPKTIDNDIWGTDRTFGYQTAVEISTEILDKLRTTADSHNRVIVVELMGNKVGWLALNAGISGEADIILIPEILYSEERVIEDILGLRAKGCESVIIVVAEGAKSYAESTMSKKEYKKVAELNSVGQRLGKMIESRTGVETRVIVPGHIIRGGSPNAFDRALATAIGAYSSQLIKDEKYGVTVSVRNTQLIATPLENVAGKSRKIEEDNILLRTGKMVGTSFGEFLDEEKLKGGL